MQEQLEYRLLGPLQVLRQGEPLELGGPQRRTLLAALLVGSGAVVSTDRLAEALWGDRPPATADKSLQTHVWQLRRILEPERATGDRPRILLTTGSGYLLETDPRQVDARDFEDLLERAEHRLEIEDAPGALALVDEALELWRGRPLDDLADRSFFRAEVARLEELYGRALELRAEARLEAGQHSDLVPEVRRLVADYPLRERLWEHLMLALYRSGRQAEALRAFREAQALLGRELGVEPGPGLRRLEQRMLVQDPTLHRAAAASATPAEPPGSALRRIFVGRQRELAALRAAFDRASGGQGGVVLLTGEAGIGKTRTMEELGSHVRMQGGRMLRGMAEEDPGMPPYGPFLQVLRSYLDEIDPLRLQQELGPEGTELARLLPEVRKTLDLAPADPPPDLARARYRLFEALGSFLRRVASTSPLTVVLDDLQWADPSSLLLLQHLARRLEGSRLLVVGAYRAQSPQEVLSDLVSELARTDRFELLELEGLDRPAVAELLRSSSRSVPSADTIARLHRLTGGNPFFLTELISLMAVEDEVVGEEITIPPTVTATVERRLRSLSDEARELLALAAVAGSGFELGLVAELADLPEHRALDLVEQALAAGLLEDAEGADRFRFGHPIVRETLLDGLSQSRRLRLHTRAAQALERRHADHPERVAPELAFHYSQSTRLRPGHAAKAVRYAKMAARQAEAASAWGEAATLYERALGMLPEDGGPAEEAHLALRLGVCRRLQGNAGDAGRAFRRAFGLYRRAEDARGMAETVLEAVRDGVWLDEARAVEMAEVALEANRDAGPELRARLLARRAWDFLGFDALSDAAAREAEELARRHELSEVLVEIRDREAHRALHEARFLDARQHAEEVRRLAAGIDEPDIVAHAMLEISRAHLSEGDLASARRTAEDLSRYAEVRDLEHWRHEATFLLTAMAFLEADWGALESLLEELAASAFIYPAFMHSARAELAGEVDAARKIWAEVPETTDIESLIAPMRSCYYGVQARLETAAGHPEEADEAVIRWARALEETPPGMYAAVAIAELDEETVGLLDDGLAHRTYQQLVSYEARVAVVGRPLDSVRGILALRLGLVDQAEAHFRSGLEWAEREGCVLEVARTLGGLARVAQQGGDLQEAERLGSAAAEALSAALPP